MKIIIFVLSLIVGIKTISYGIFEINNKNKFGGYFVTIFSIITVLLSNIIVFIKGI